MRRILLVTAATALMAAMVLVSAVPALAKINETPAGQAVGGEGARGGGNGGRLLLSDNTAVSSGSQGNLLTGTGTPGRSILSDDSVVTSSGRQGNIVTDSPGHCIHQDTQPLSCHGQPQ